MVKIGKRGPLPKEPALKLLEGQRSDRVNLDAPKADGKIPKCPAYIPPEGKKVWADVTTYLADKGLLDTVDAFDLEGFVMAVVTHRKAARRIAKYGPVVKGRDVMVKNPALQPMWNASAEIRAYSRKFGLSPEDRAGLKVPAPEGPDLSDILKPVRRGATLKA